MRPPPPPPPLLLPDGTVPRQSCRCAASPLAALFHHPLHQRPTSAKRAFDYLLEAAAWEAPSYPQACRERYHGLPFLRTINASWQQPVCTPQVTEARGGWPPSVTTAAGCWARRLASMPHGPFPACDPRRPQAR